MNRMLFNLYLKFQELKNSEEGQDIAEYTLVVALIAFGAVSTLTSLSGGLNSAFTKMSASLSSNIT